MHSSAGPAAPTRRFELDYWSLAATEALRRLERRVGYDTSLRSAETPPSILICIPWREPNVSAMLQRPWIVETDPDKADFIIATELWPCGRDQPVELIDEVKRLIALLHRSMRAAPLMPAASLDLDDVKARDMVEAFQAGLGGSRL